MFRSFFEASKPFLFWLVAAAIWANWSLVALLEPNPVDFQASGSLVVAWAIFWYGQDVFKRENAVATAQRNAMVASIDLLQIKHEFSTSLSHNTADMNSLAYLKLLKTLGIRDETVGDTDIAIAQLEKRNENTEAHEALHKRLMEANQKATDANSHWANFEDTQAPWIKVVRRVELWLVVIGTVQWGYGDRWVKGLVELGVLG